jgi:AhpD family alkylhydroperoxidase
MEVVYYTMRYTDSSRWYNPTRLHHDPSPGILFPPIIFCSESSPTNGNPCELGPKYFTTYHLWESESPNWNEIYLSSRILELIRLRVAIVDDCRPCISQHVSHLNAMGEATNRIEALKSWYESDLFDPSERAALALTDLLCGSKPAPVSNTIGRARQYFNEGEMLMIILTALAHHE